MVNYKVKVNYAEDDPDGVVVRERLTEWFAKKIIEEINKLPWSYDDKIRLLNDVKKDIREREDKRNMLVNS